MSTLKGGPSLLGGASTQSMMSTATSSSKKLLDSGSLVDLLNIKRKPNGGKRAKASSGGSYKPSKESMDLIATIIKEETGKNAQNFVRKKKKPAEAADKGKVGKKSTFLVEDANIQLRARSFRKTSNNIFTLSSGLGLSGDDAAYVERQNQPIRTLLTAVERKIDEGYMQICGDNTSRFTNSDGSLLINYTSLVFDKLDFARICEGSCLETEMPIPEEYSMNFDRWKTGVLASFRKRFIISVLGERRGQVPASFIKTQLDLLLVHKNLKFVSSGELLRKTYSFKDSMMFSRGGISSSGGGGGGMPYDDNGDDEAKTVASSVHQFNETADVDLFSATMDDEKHLKRSNSQPSGDILSMTRDSDRSIGGDDSRLGDNMRQNSFSSEMMTAASRSGFSVPSLDLPPLRSKKKASKQLQKRNLIEDGGFDDNFGRTTPRCLKTNAKSKPSIHALRRELQMAQESANMLNNLVDDNIAWVNTNCKDIKNSIPNAVSVRTKERCRRLALDKMFDFFENMWDGFMIRVLQKWKAYSKFNHLQQMAVTYNKAKGLEVLCWALGEAINRQYIKAWRPWFAYCKKCILAERDAASCDIQKIIRGFLGRIKAFRIKLGRFAVKIQCMARKKSAKKRVQKKRKERNIKLVNAAAKTLQEWLRGRVRVFKAKRRVMRRRYHRAATRIQKVFRGHKGRHRYAAIKSKIMASMKPKTPQGKGVLNSVKSWFGPAAEPVPSPTKVEKTTVEPIHSSTPMAKKKEKEKKQSAPTPPEKGEKVETDPVVEPKPAVSKPVAKEVSIDKILGGSTVKDIKQSVDEPVVVNKVQVKKEPAPIAQKPAIPNTEVEQPKIEQQPKIEATVSSIDFAEETVNLNDNNASNNANNDNEDNQSEITSSRMGSTTDIEEMDENGVIKIQKIFRGKLSRDQKEKKLAEKKSKGQVKSFTEKASNAVPTNDSKPTSAVAAATTAAGTLEKKKMVSAVKPPAAAIASSTPQESATRPVSQKGPTEKPDSSSSNAGTSSNSSATSATSEPSVAAASSRPSTVSLPSLKRPTTSEEKEKVLQVQQQQQLQLLQQQHEQDQIQQAMKQQMSTIGDDAEDAVPYNENDIAADEDRPRSSGTDNRPSTGNTDIYYNDNNKNNNNSMSMNSDLFKSAVEDNGSHENNVAAATSDNDKPGTPLTSSSSFFDKAKDAMGMGSSGVSSRPNSSSSLLSSSASPSRMASFFSRPSTAKAPNSESIPEDQTAATNGDGAGGGSASAGNSDTIANGDRPLSKNENRPLTAGIRSFFGGGGGDGSATETGTANGGGGVDASNDGALSSRFATPEKLRDMMDKAKEMLNPLQRKLSEHGSNLASLVMKNIDSARASTPLRRVPKKKFVRPNMTQEEACGKIQAAVRIKVAKARVNLIRNKIIKKQTQVAKLLVWAVRTMQRIVRGRLGRKRFKAQEFYMKGVRAKKQETSAVKIQKMYRGLKGRKKFKALDKKRQDERQMAQWMKYSKSTKKKGKKGGGSAEGVSGKPGVTSQKGGAANAAQPVGPNGMGAIPDSWDEEEEDEKERMLQEKLAKLEELEKRLNREQEKMEASKKASEQQQANMMKALNDIQEKLKQEEAERLAREQLAVLAGGISHRSDFYSSQGSIGRNTGRGGGGGGATGRKMNTARDGPPTARSARDGIPSDAPRISHSGKEWRQLYDPDQKAMYWFCPATQEAQWETPGDEVNYDSGYESSGGALTDYSTDYESGNENIYQTGGGSIWQEFFDEQAQSKYWYNSQTGEATWTKPAGAASSRGGGGGGGSFGGGGGGGGGGNPGSSRAGGNANDWVSYLDESTGQEYWYNHTTGETSWA